MALATADNDGRPSVRMVLLRGADERGFVFHTNYTSRKALELTENPHAALCVHWHSLEEQIRIEGPVERLSDAESDAYFASRPRGSQLGAWASRQSAPLASRETLEEEYRAVERRFEGEERAAATLLGRLQADPGTHRVLVRPARSPARPAPLPAQGRRLDDRAAVSLKPCVASGFSRKAA